MRFALVVLSLSLVVADHGDATARRRPTPRKPIDVCGPFWSKLLGQGLSDLAECNRQTTDCWFKRGAIKLSPVATPERICGAAWVKASLVKAVGELKITGENNLFAQPRSWTQTLSTWIGKADQTTKGFKWNKPEAPKPVPDTDPKKEPAPREWPRMPGSLRQVSVAKDGAVWGVNMSDQIYQWMRPGWQLRGGGRYVSAGSESNVWSLTGGAPYKWNGSSWDRVPFRFGDAMTIAVADDGTVVVTTREFLVFRLAPTGNPTVNPTWDPMGCCIKQVSAGSAKDVWGLGSDARVYRWDGQNWVNAPPAASMTSISAASDGTVIGTNSNRQIFKWLGQGQLWVEVKGAKLTQISAGDGGKMWGVSDRDVFRLR